MMKNMKAYYNKNKEKALVKGAKYYEKNKESRKEYSKAYYQRKKLEKLSLAAV